MVVINNCLRVSRKMLVYIIQDGAHTVALGILLSVKVRTKYVLLLVSV